MSHLFTRREALALAGASAVSLAMPGWSRAADPAGFTLPKLSYAYDALEPAIDALTMETHHSKHHKAYVDNLNKALASSPEWLKKPIEAIVADLKSVPEGVRMAVRNNGGGHYNHTLFWSILAPEAKSGKPEGELAKAIEAGFKSLDGLYAALKDAGMTQFGSGWAWLVVTPAGLKVTKTPNQDNPLMDGSGSPILGIDVWEHAYYLKYKNLRASYIDAFFKVINWPAVSALYAAAKKS